MAALREFYDVAEAAAYLDVRDPKWYKRVTKIINMEEPERCVAGQNAIALGNGKGWWYDQVKSWGIAPQTWKATGEREWNIWCSRQFNGAWQNEVDLRKACFRDDTTPVTAEPESERVTILAGNSVYEVDRTFDGLMRLLSHLDVDLKEREVTKL